MARSRSIKPAFFQNEDLAELSPLTRLAFIGMWTIADCKGYLEYRTKRLKVQILPYDDANMEQIVNDLEKARLIRIYSVQGREYIHIDKFEKHQHPHMNEMKVGSEIEVLLQSNNFPIVNKEMTQDGTKPDFIGTTPPLTLNPITLTLNPITDTIKNNTPPKQMPSPVGVCVELWSDYMALRKTKKSAMTKTALSGLERECNKAGLSLEAGIRVCCERGWASLKAEWLDDKKLTVHQQQMQASARTIGFGRTPDYETLHTFDNPQLENHDHDNF